SKEKQLADDPAKPWQGIDIEMLWPLLLESAMTGRQIDTTHLLSVMLTGKPGASAASAPTAAAQQDINALLLPLLVQLLTGKPDALAANTSAPTAAGQRPIDITALLLPLLFQVLTGKPDALAANTSAPTAAGQRPIDINALLLPLLFPLLNGKPWPGTAS